MPVGAGDKCLKWPAPSQPMCCVPICPSPSALHVRPSLGTAEHPEEYPPPLPPPTSRMEFQTHAEAPRAAATARWKLPLCPWLC